ncbi:MAG TPA: metal ABC transporter substrate-binding protein [Candidatus Binatia bacterium]|jgi:ABC-type Zn uptake system ZnuABC Zn-binding protein ZnuA|nr:metal ABC transporter substrate-binding protein [Candidatus Binatia bacterium]
MLRTFLLLVVLATVASAEPLRVCATTPDLGNLTSEIGGDEVAVTVFARGPEDPHFVEAKPSFVKSLSDAQLLVVSGLDLEIGYLPPLLNGARNADVMPGGHGYLDAATAITPMAVPTGVIDRSMGDIHPFGNPHYLTDPLNGLLVAALLRDTLTGLRPAARDTFATRYDDFRARLGARLVSEPLAAKYEFEKLATLFELGKLESFLASQPGAPALGGWLGAMQPYHGAKAVDDHPLWPYFARRFAIDIVGDMEPKPGIPPTTRHLGELVGLMKDQNVKLILASAYYDPRHARFLAEQTGARVAAMASQVGARDGTSTYLDMVDYNVRQVTAALAGAK